QTNGVVTTLKCTAETLTSLGHVVRIISPQGLSCFACPSYPEIRLALWPGPYVARELEAFRPHAIHIATEGPLGLAVRRYCRALRPHPELSRLPRPLMACVGRLAIEKNLEAFLGLDLPGTKVMIGDGPERQTLEARYPGAVFTGYRFGEELVHCLSAADVLVFPSLTDTFGLAMIEANACGVPVAAFPVPGPLDVIEQDVTGVLHDDLAEAIRSALRLDRRTCAARAARFSRHAACR